MTSHFWILTCTLREVCWFWREFSTSCENIRNVMSLSDFNDNTFIHSFEKVGFMDSSDCVFWVCFGYVLDTFWISFEYVLGLFLVYFGYVSGMFWVCLYVFGMFRVCFGYVSDMLWVFFGYVSGMFRVCFGYAFGMFSVCFGYVSGMFRVCFGYVLGKFWGQNCRLDARSRPKF